MSRIVSYRIVSRIPDQVPTYLFTSPNLLTWGKREGGREGGSSGFVFEARYT